jgi:hypothetical protein
MNSQFRQLDGETRNFVTRNAVLWNEGRSKEFIANAPGKSDSGTQPGP